MGNLQTKRAQLHHLGKYAYAHTNGANVQVYQKEEDTVTIGLSKLKWNGLMKTHEQPMKPIAKNTPYVSLDTQVAKQIH